MLFLRSRVESWLCSAVFWSMMEPPGYHFRSVYSSLSQYWGWSRWLRHRRALQLANKKFSFKECGWVLRNNADSEARACHAVAGLFNCLTSFLISRSHVRANRCWIVPERLVRSESEQKAFSGCCRLFLWNSPNTAARENHGFVWRKIHAQELAMCGSKRNDIGGGMRTWGFRDLRDGAIFIFLLTWRVHSFICIVLLVSLMCAPQRNAHTSMSALSISLFSLPSRSWTVWHWASKAFPTKASWMCGSIFKVCKDFFSSTIGEIYTAPFQETWTEIVVWLPFFCCGFMKLQRKCLWCRFLCDLWTPIVRKSRWFNYCPGSGVDHYFRLRPFT